MNYGTGSGGRVDRHPSEAGSISYEDVIERLVEAWGFLRRMPDRERGFLREPRSPWPEIMRHSFFGDYPNVEPEDRPRLPGLRASEVDRMNEVLGLGGEPGWMRWVPTRDRALFGVVLAQLDRGEARPQWIEAARRLGGGVMPDTLRKRFDLGVSTIAAKLNATNRVAKLAEIRT